MKLNTVKPHPLQRLQIMNDVLPGTVWKHYNGIIYKVLLLANEETKNHKDYPITVVYFNVENTKEQNNSFTHKFIVNKIIEKLFA